MTVGVRESPEGVQDVLYRSGVTQAKPEGTHWEKMESKLSHVTVGLRGIMGIMHDGTVIVHRGMLIIVHFLQYYSVECQTKNFGSYYVYYACYAC